MDIINVISRPQAIDILDLMLKEGSENDEPFHKLAAINMARDALVREETLSKMLVEIKRND